MFIQPDQQLVVAYSQLSSDKERRNFVANLIKQRDKEIARMDVMRAAVLDLTLETIRRR
jgi:hypothetical protein